MQCIYTSWFTRWLSDFHCESFCTKWDYVSVLMVLPSIKQFGCFTLPSCHPWTPWTTSSIIFHLKLHTLFNSDFNCDTASGHSLFTVSGHWVWTGENASEEAEEPDQHPWQSEAVFGLSQATLASEHHGRAGQQSSPASGGPFLTSTRDTVGKVWRQKAAEIGIKTSF